MIDDGIEVTISGKQVDRCKYGENKDQKGASLFSTQDGPDHTKDPLAMANFLIQEGSDRSFNNWCDTDRLVATMAHYATARWVNELKVAQIIIGVKHGNPCGAAWCEMDEDFAEAARLMMAGHPLAIFGGSVIMNQKCTKEIAQALLIEGKAQLDTVIAPSFEIDAVNILSRKSGKCRLIVNPALENLHGQCMDTESVIRPVRKGFLDQDAYSSVLNFNDPGLAIYGTPYSKYEEALLFGRSINATSNSNTITLVKGRQLVGNGAGQQASYIACHLAVWLARDANHVLHDPGAPVVADSDSFFPFRDGPQILIDAGIRAIFATSGSINDEKIIALCEKHGVTLYMKPDAEMRGFFGH